jgi:hypothetical protein
MAVAFGVFCVVTLGTLIVQGPSIRPSRPCMVDTWHMTRAIPWVGAAVLAILAYRVVLLVISRQLRRAVVVVGEGPYRQNIVEHGTALARPKRHEVALALLVLLGGGIGALQSRSWSCTQGLPASCRAEGVRKVFLMTVGPADPSYVAKLRAHFRDCYGLPTELGGAFVPDSSMFDDARQQWKGEPIIAKMPQVCAEHRADCAGALVIGVTPLDIYTTREQWRFAFAVRDAGVALVSTARMSGLLADTRDGRARKMLAKTIAVQYCGLEPSSDPRSIRYGNILSLGDLDAIDEAIW